MAAAQKSAAGLSTSLNTQNAGFSTLTKVAAGFGVAAAVGIGSAVSAFSDFDAAMSGVAAATMATGSELDALGEAALTAGESTVFSATEAAGAITELAKAGISTSDIMGGALTGALDLAAAGELEVADAAAIAAAAMTQFNLSGSEVPHIADLLAAAAGKAQGSVTDMGAALNQTGLVASQMGLSLEETVGTLAAFASAGLIGSDAGTSFRTMLLRLANPSQEAAQLMDELGIATYDAQGNFIGMEALAGELQTALSGLTEEQRNAALATIFGSDAIRGASILYEEGAAGIRTWNQEVNDAAYAAEQAAIKTDNLKGDLERLGGAFDSLLITIGGGFDAALRGVVQALTDLIDGFNNLEGTAADEFFQSVGETAGNLWQILVNLWDALGPVIVGFAELAGGAVVGGLTLIAGALSAITGFLADNEKLVTALAVAVGGALVASFVAAQYKALSLAVTVAALNGSTMAGVIAGTTSLTAALGTARVAAAGLVAALGPIAVVAGLAVAVTSLLSIGAASAEAEEAVNSLFDAIADADTNAEAFELTRQGIEDTTASMEDMQAQIDDMRSTSSIGDWFGDVLAVFSEGPSTIGDATGAFIEYAVALGQLEGIQAQLTSNTSKLQAEFGLTEEGVLALADAAGVDLTQGFNDVIGPMRDAAEASQEVTAAEAETEAAIAGLEGGLLDTAEAADALVTAFEGLTGGFRSVLEAEIGFEQAMRDAAAAALALANEALGPMDNALDEATGGLDTHTEAGAAVVKMLTDTTDAGIAYIEALVEQGRTEEAIAAEGALRQSLYDTLAAFGIVGPAADAFVNSLLLIPGEVTTLIDLQTEDADAAIAALQASFDGLTLEALVGVAAGFTAAEIQAMVDDVMGTNNLEAALGLTVDEQEALAEIAAITGIPYAVLIRLLMDPASTFQFDLDAWLAEKEGEGLNIPVGLIGLDDGKKKLDDVVNEPRNVTVFAGADTTDADTKLNATTSADWRTVVYAGGDTTDADAKIGATSNYDWRALITAYGDSWPADGTISNTAYYDWRALITAYGDSWPADATIAGTAYADWNALIVASASTGSAESALNYTARNRTSTVYQYTVTAAASGGYVAGYAKGGAARSFPAGGPVWGAGTGTSDSINARLSTGEFVVNAESTARNRGALEAANWDGVRLMVVPGFADGNAVGGRIRDRVRDFGRAHPNVASKVEMNPNFNVRVLLGTKDITEMVDMRIDRSDIRKKLVRRSEQRMAK